MSELTPRFADLHTIPAERESTPELIGSRCAECGYLTFPARRFGCPACGALPEAAQAALLAGVGTLEALTTVHRPVGHALAPPYVVGVVRLDAGVEVEAILEADHLEELAPGQRMRACLLETGQHESGATLVECRFTPEASR